MTNPTCPRCGYDLSGHVASWGSAWGAGCPLDGQCSECGLEFAWRDVLVRAERASPRRIEHYPRTRVPVALPPPVYHLP